MDIPAKIGRYEILERIGRGGMGVVYRGRDPVLDREVAIKIMLADFEQDEAARPRFYREAKAAAKLQHRNIVTVYEFGEEEQTPYIVMEFLRGQDLARRLRAEPPLTLVEKLDVVAELCTGLHFAHQQGVIHRDVKPGNIWLLPDGSVKLVDFGIAKVESSWVTRAGTAIFGSAAYMAPEHVLGQPVDARADIFSAGVVLYEIIAGRRPFEAETPTAVLARIAQDKPEPIDQVVPGLPRALVTAVAGALEKDPQRRYQQAGDLATELRIIRAALSAGPQAASSVDLPTAPMVRPVSQSELEPGSTVPIVSRPAPIGRPARAGRGAFALAAAAAVLLVAAVVGYLWFAHAGPATVNRSPFAAVPPSPSEQAKKTVPGRAESAPSETASNAAVTTAPEKKTAATRTRDAAPTPKTGLAAVPQPSAGVVSIHGSYAFEVLDGSEVLSPLALSHEVTVKGRHTLRIRSGEYLLDQSITVDPADPRRRDIEIPEPGYLTLRWAAENCSAHIGGKELGFPPVNERPIAAGTHQVRFTCPDGTEKRVSVTIRPGERKVEPVRW